MKISEKQKALLEHELVALVSINSDGSPNVICVLAVKVVSENEIIITDNYMHNTKDNILKDPRVCLGVWTKEEGYKFIGHAKYYSQGEWLQYIKNLPENKDYPAKGVIYLRVEKIVDLGKVN